MEHNSFRSSFFCLTFNKVKIKLNINEIKIKIDFNIVKVYYKYQVERRFLYMDNIPAWLSEMDEQELDFIKLFLISSGSLKELAKHYEITYPTIRLRLDRLIQKIEITEKEKSDDLISLVKELTLQDKLDLTTAKQLIDAYQKEKK